MSAKLTYAGVRLLNPHTESDVLSRIVENIDWASFPELLNPSWTGLGESRSPEFVGGNYPVPLGRLYYPRDATNCCRGHFLVDEESLQAIRSTVYTETGVDPARLFMEEGVSTKLYMLPPRPIFQFDDPDGTGKNLYLLTLVCERYWWWQKSAAIGGAASDWTSLFNSIKSALGIDLTIETAIESEYLKPSDFLTLTRDQHISVLFDAAAYSVGRRVVRKLDGTYLLQKASDAFAVSETLLESYEKYTTWGGKFCFDQDANNDIPAAIPDTVRMVFDVIDSRRLIGDDDPSSNCQVRCSFSKVEYDALLEDLAIDGFDEVVAKSGVHPVYSTAAAWSNNDGVTISNASELQDLTDQFANDWYSWQISDQSRVLAGIRPWDGDGSVDVIEYEAYPLQRTKVLRMPMNDLSRMTYHRAATTPTSPCVVRDCFVDSSSSYYGDCECYTKIGDFDVSKIPGWNANAVQILSHDTCGGSACLKWLDVGYCDG